MTSHSSASPTAKKSLWILLSVVVIDLIGFGPVFQTVTKDKPDPVVGTGLLRQAVALAHPVQVVAIGGIGLDQLASVKATGAQAFASIGAVFGGEDPLRRAALLAEQWERV